VAIIETATPALNSVVNRLAADMRAQPLLASTGVAPALAATGLLSCSGARHGRPGPDPRQAFFRAADQRLYASPSAPFVAPSTINGPQRCCGPLTLVFLPTGYVFLLC
jgi:hypothetical protein